MNHRDRGMTLLEVLMVLVVLAVVSTAGFFAVRGLSDDAQTSSCEIEVKQINAAIRAYYSENKVWIKTATLSALVPDYIDVAPSASGSSGAGTVGGDRIYRSTKC